MNPEEVPILINESNAISGTKAQNTLKFGLLVTVPTGELKKSVEVCITTGEQLSLVSIEANSY